MNKPGRMKESAQEISILSWNINDISDKCFGKKTCAPEFLQTLQNNDVFRRRKLRSIFPTGHATTHFDLTQGQEEHALEFTSQ